MEVEMTNWKKFNGEYEELLVDASNRAIRLLGEKLAAAEREIKGRKRSGKPMSSEACFAFLQALIKDPVLAGETETSGALGFLSEDFVKALPSLFSEDQSVNPNSLWEEEINLDVCALVLKDFQRVYHELVKASQHRANQIPSHVLRYIISEVYV
jgi:hypothetical protein